jgi:hypothetical protein
VLRSAQTGRIIHEKAPVPAQRVARRSASAEDDGYPGR